MSDIDYSAETVKANVQKAFAPVIDAVKTVQSKMEIPEAAREFVKRGAETAKERASDMHATTAKATDAIESAATKSVTELAALSRKMQAAAYDDATALFASVTKLASVKSLEEAVQVHVDYLRERSDVNIGRAKSVLEFVTSSLTDGAKKAQENFAKAAETFSSKAA